MSGSEQVQDWDGKIAGAVQRAVDELREEIYGRLLETREELRELLHREAPRPVAEAMDIEAVEEGATPAPLLESVSPEHAPEPIAAPPGPSPAEVLREAVAGIDRADSQANILATLVDGAIRFASRSLLFLTRPDGAHGWSAAGFDSAPEVRGITVEYGPGTPWETLSLGRGSVSVDTAGCAALAERLAAPPAARGVLVPLVLRDRVAAALYADRMDDEGELEVAALQVLTFAAAQALETLPFRERSSTPTLYLAPEGPPNGTGLRLWEPPEISAGADDEEGDVTPSSLLGPAVEMETLPQAPLGEEAFAATSGAALGEGLREPSLPEETGIPEQVLEAAGAGGWDLEDAGPEEAAPSGPSPLAGLAGLSPEPALLPALRAAEELPESGLDETHETLPPLPPGQAPSERLRTVEEIERSPEVAAPAGFEGPGSAFAAGRTPGEAVAEAEREEARRLARLLVSEIKLYNEELVEDGRLHKDIYRRLGEDIERSRQLFEERVDARIREERDFFQDELVRILAGGDADALGG